MVSEFTMNYATSTHHHICCMFDSGSLWNIFDLPQYDKVCHRLSAYRRFSPCIPMSSTNNRDTLIYTVGDVLFAHSFNFKYLNNKHQSILKGQSTMDNQVFSVQFVCSFFHLSVYTLYFCLFFYYFFFCFNKFYKIYFCLNIANIQTEIPHLYTYIYSPYNQSPHFNLY